MSSVSFVSVCLSGASVILLLTVSQAQDYDFTPSPDDDLDYNATFEYSFYSNTSTEDLEKFSEQFIDQDEEEDTGGSREEEGVVITTEEEGVVITTATPQGTTDRNSVDVSGAASLPVSLEIRTLVWTLVILISLNLQQLQHTL